MSKKVVVGLSGGVDSTVAAILLIQKNFEVHGLCLITCPGAENDAIRAQQVADQLNIPLTSLDIQEEFHHKVIQAFAQSYHDGETPSPCLDCNRIIKWEHMLSFADEVGAEYIATGHYARIVQNEKDEYELHKGKDSNKDQSYMLSRLTQMELSRTLFPLGTLIKTEVREIAAQSGITISKKEESQDLCFLEGTNYRDFLKEHLSFREETGLVQLLDGTILGEHQGLSAYTIGQRKGLPAYKHPLFVIQKRQTDNTLIVGDAEDLGQSTFSVREINWISGKKPELNQNIQCKIRYRATPVSCAIQLKENHKADIHTKSTLRDITPGQFAVFYQDDKVLGSGIINEDIQKKHP